jgi:hypothetical protein
MKKLMPFLLILISIGVFFFFIDPQYKELKAVQEQIKENDKMLALTKDLQRERENLEDKFKNISDKDKAKLEKVLPSAVDNVRLILDINNIADDFGIVISGIGVTGGPNEATNEKSKNPTTAKTTGEYGKISLSFSTSASYDVFKAFISRLEESLRLVDVRGFTITTGQSAFYNYTINLETYWLR